MRGQLGAPAGDEPAPFDALRDESTDDPGVQISNPGYPSIRSGGQVVSGGSKCNPRKGYICLESEGSECHFRNVRIRELPSSNPPATVSVDWATGGGTATAGSDYSAASGTTESTTGASRPSATTRS